MDAWTTSCGLLHSEISGSMLAYNSPLLIAVNHVLLRLSMPRHSLCALLCFTICSFGSSQNFRVQLFVVFFTQHFGYSPSCRCFYLLVVFTCICFHYSVFKLHFFLSFSKNRYQQMIFFIYWYLLLQARHFFFTQSFSFKNHRVSLKPFLW